MIFHPLFVLFDLILYVPSTIFQLNRDGFPWVELVLSWDKCALLKDHNTVTPVAGDKKRQTVRTKIWVHTVCQRGFENT